MQTKQNLKIEYVPITSLKLAAYNPRKHTPEAITQLKTSIERFDMVDPVIINSASRRRNIVIGGHMRIKALKEMGVKKVPAVFVNIPELVREKELNVRLNKNTGEFDFGLLADFAKRSSATSVFRPRRWTIFFSKKIHPNNSISRKS